MFKRGLGHIINNILDSYQDKFNNLLRTRTLIYTIYCDNIYYNAHVQFQINNGNK